MLIFLFFCVLLSSVYAASAVVYLPEYPEEYMGVAALKKTAEMYYSFEEERGVDVRYVSSLSEVTPEDTILYIVSHGNENGIISVTQDTDGSQSSKLIVWLKILQTVKENEIRILVIDSCSAGSIHEIAETINFTRSVKIYTSCEDGESTGAPKGMASYYSCCWRYGENFNPEYKLYKASVFSKDRFAEMREKKEIKTND